MTAKQCIYTIYEDVKRSVEVWKMKFLLANRIAKNDLYFYDTLVSSYGGITFLCGYSFLIDV